MARREAEDRARRNRTIKWVFLLALLALLVAFVVQNLNQRATVQWVFFERKSRVFLVMAVSAVIGWIVGFLMGRPSKIERRIIKEQADRYKRDAD